MPPAFPRYRLLAPLLLATSLFSAEPPIDLGTRRELFVDQFLIARLEGVQLKLHEPRREGIALKFDEPWEGPFCAYVTVIKDGDLYRMYYRGKPDAGKGSIKREVTCYAESKDGIVWTKPHLELFEVMGTRENNVILPNQDLYNEGFAPFLDTRPNVAPDERYKALTRTKQGKGGLIPLASADGIHWRVLQTDPMITEGNFDSQNVAFWSASEGCYVAYFRVNPKINGTIIRLISRTTSADFIHWTQPVRMEYGDRPLEQLYTSATHPYFRAPHIYIALPKRFFPDKVALSSEQAKALVKDPNYRIASSDSVLMTTRGGNHYERTFMEAFIRPGPDPEDWISRDNQPAMGVVPGNAREMFIYRLSHYAQPSIHLFRYSLRTDGFISVNAPYQGGEMVTRLVQFSGKTLEINFNSSAAGGLRVEIQDAEGNPIPGYALADSPEVIGDEITHVITWKEKGTDLSSLSGRPVRLRFVMHDADLYSLRFAP